MYLPACKDEYCPNRKTIERLQRDIGLLELEVKKLKELLDREDKERRKMNLYD